MLIKISSSSENKYFDVDELNQNFLLHRDILMIQASSALSTIY